MKPLADVRVKAAIVDFGGCNLFSVRHACQSVGMEVEWASDPSGLRAADLVILPGVGAFGDAMQALHQRDLVEPLKDYLASGKPFVGICLGLQLLFSESFEFGEHRGLEVIKGAVRKFPELRYGSRNLKIPHVGWNQVFSQKKQAKELAKTPSSWKATPLKDAREGDYVYFVHSYYVEPEDASVELTYTQYGNFEFCSSVRKGNVYGFQFHPEHSGEAGVQIYRNIGELSA